MWTQPVVLLALISSLACTCRKDHEANLDQDGDGHQRGADDCDDDDSQVYKGAPELCDGKDNDCDTEVDEDDAIDATTWFHDTDGDGFGDVENQQTACENPGGLLTDSADCNDHAAAIHPGAEELCDGLDNDCDGAIDEDATGLLTTWYEDADGDGYGDADHSVQACEAPSGFVFRALDCDDGDAATYPGASEVCDDGTANDCDAGPDAALASCLPAQILGSEADARLAGEARNDFAGAAVSGAGDVNGDGRVDFLVGASNTDDAGAAYLILDTPSGDVALVSRIKLAGENDGDWAGDDLAGVGDMNDDGFDDFVVGAWGEATAGEQAGAVYLLLGPVLADQDLADADAKLTGEGADGCTGVAVTGLGDFNGDGTSDLAIGAYEEIYGASNAGVVYLFTHQPTGTRDVSTADSIFWGENAGDGAGVALAGVGDVDGDGLGDLLVGAQGYDSTSAGASVGAVYLVLGDVQHADTSILWAMDYYFRGENEGAHAGNAVAGAGDVDGDGLDDMLVGAYDDDSNGSSAGAVYLVKGAAYQGSWGQSLADFTMYVGSARYGQLGWSVAGGEDVDGDGRADIILGAGSGNPDGGHSAFVFLEYEDAVMVESLAADLELTTSESSALGWSVALPGDIDGDNLSEVLVGDLSCCDGGDEGGAYLLYPGRWF